MLVVGYVGEVDVCRAGRVACGCVICQCHAVGRGCHGFGADTVEGYAYCAGFERALEEVAYLGRRIKLKCLYLNGLRRGGRRFFDKVEKAAERWLRLWLYFEACDERFEFELLIDGDKGFGVGFLTAQRLGGDVGGNVGDDGDELFRHAYLPGVVYYFFLQRAFELVGIVEKILYRAELGDEFSRRLLSHTGAAGHIVGGVALECKQVYYLTRRGNAIALAHLLGAADLEALTFDGRAVHEHAVGDELAVVLVGRHHVCGEPFFAGASRECAYHIVGLISLDLYHRYSVGLEDILDVWYGQSDVFGLFVASGLVFGVLLMAESMAVGRIEAHGDISGILLLEEVVESIYKAENRRGVEAGRCHSRRAQQGIVGTVDQRVGVEQKEFLFFHL